MAHTLLSAHHVALKRRAIRNGNTQRQRLDIERLDLAKLGFDDNLVDVGAVDTLNGIEAMSKSIEPMNLEWPSPDCKTLQSDRKVKGVQVSQLSQAMKGT